MLVTIGYFVAAPCCHHTKKMESLCKKLVEQIRLDGNDSIHMWHADEIGQRYQLSKCIKSLFGSSIHFTMHTYSEFVLHILNLRTKASYDSTNGMYTYMLNLIFRKVYYVNLVSH